MDPVSAIGLADNCLSFANALYTYITIVANAKDDIQRVSGELQATSVVLRDLGKLVEKYQHTEAWKGERMAYAQGCLDKTEKNIAKMKEMLLKTSATSTSPNVEHGDIDLNKLQLLVIWPWRRSKLEERRAELAGSKLDVLLAYMMYTASAIPHTAEGKQAAAQIPGLYRASRVAKQKIRSSKQRNKSRQAPEQQRSQDTVSDDLDGPEPHDYDVGEDALVYENEDDLRRDFEDWVREKEEKKREADAKQKRLEEDAVEAWKKAQRDQAQQQLREVREQRSKLQSELEKQRLAPKQIRDALDHLHPLPRHDNGLAPISLNGDDDTLTTDPTDIAGRGLLQDQPERSLLSRLGGLFVKRRANHGAHQEIPIVLQDPTRPGGFAEVAILLFEKTFTPSGHNVVQINCEFEPQWLIHTLREIETRHRRSDFDPALKEFAKLPSQYRFAISAATQSYNSNPDSPFKWVLIFVRCLRLGRSHSWLKRSESRIKGVYIALKKTTVSPANDDLNEVDTVAVELDRDKLLSDLRRERNRARSRTRERYSSSSDDESEEIYEPRRASRSRSRQASRLYSRQYPYAETSIAKRANRLSQVRPDNDDTSEDGRLPVRGGDYAFPEPIIINNRLSRPRSRERTRPRRETYETNNIEPFDRSIVRRQSTNDIRQPLPVVLAQPQQPYPTSSLPVVFVPPRQQYTAQQNPFMHRDYYEHRRTGDTYDTMSTNRRQTETMSRTHHSTGSFPSRRQTSTDSYKIPKHTRFADTPEEIVVQRNRSDSHRPNRRTHTPINLARIEKAMKQIEYETSSSSEEDANDNGIRLEQSEHELSDDRITEQLLSRFQNQDGYDHFRSASAPASFFGGAISEEPGSHGSVAGSQVGDNAILEEGTAQFGNTRSRTIETVD